MATAPTMVFDKELRNDPEQGSMADAHLFNSTVKSLTWSGITVKVKDRETKKPRTIVENASGIVNAGKS